jgi:hypothetical protein
MCFDINALDRYNLAALCSHLIWLSWRSLQSYFISEQIARSHVGHTELRR